ncbi:hypothetical protein RhiLY_01336 [Ceratobasidium sp. AG-Ba]|nr:hypothetical protein RhiLY_01336 [Ceratobasidium sp. AG-Ba]
MIVDLRDVDNAFKSLVRFEGPSALCKAVVLSQSAAQIEELHIKRIPKYRRDNRYREELDSWARLRLLEPLPALRKLGARVDMDSPVYDRDAILRSIVNYPSKALEEVNLDVGLAAVSAVSGYTWRSTIPSKPPAFGYLNRRATLYVFVAWGENVGRVCACVRSGMPKA